MTDLQKATLIFSQCICALIESWGMQAANTHRLDCGYSIAYGEEAFDKLLERYSIRREDVLQIFNVPKHLEP